MLRSLIFVVLISISSSSSAVMNFISDVNWGCMFPMMIMGLQAPGTDPGQGGYAGQGNTAPVCSCAGQGSAVVGIPIAFWEPFAIVDTTYEAWNLIPFDLNLGLAAPYLLDGARSTGTSGKQVKSNIHYYTFPLFKMLDMFIDLPCLKNNMEFDLGMVTELLPFFQNDLLSLAAFPETVLLSNPASAFACIADAISSATGFPIDTLFWCLGAGTLYPISGTATGDNVVAANSENVARGIYFMGRTGLLREYHPSGCFSNFISIWNKSRYKFHLWYPMMQSVCIPFGFPELAWTTGLPADLISNDMSYVIWRKVDCCTMGN